MAREDRQQKTGRLPTINEVAREATGDKKKGIERPDAQEYTEAETSKME